MTTDIEWADGGTPRSRRFGDTYFSAAGGRDEVRHVFLSGNGLPDRFSGSSAFTIAELGFGTGLSFLETAHTFQTMCGPDQSLNYVSFELYPLPLSVIAQTMAPWPDLMPLCDALGQAMVTEPGWNTCRLGAVSLTLAIGDARELLDQWEGRADAWYLDGFDPRQNPELWERDLMQSVFDRTAPGGTFATYSAAGWVRRTLSEAGFDVVRTAGFGRKRHMTAGRRI